MEQTLFIADLNTFAHWSMSTKSQKYWRVPVAPGGRLGLHELWCRAPASPGAGGPVQAHSTASAKDTQTWHTASILIDNMTDMRLLYPTHFAHNTHTHLWEEGLHDGAGKLRVATEDIIEALKQARFCSLSIKMSFQTSNDDKTNSCAGNHKRITLQTLKHLF